MLALLVIAVLALGAFRKRRGRAYWVYGIAALLWVILAGPLFIDDGPITVFIRNATSGDARLMAAYAVVGVILFYGGLVWLLRQAVISKTA